MKKLMIVAAVALAAIASNAATINWGTGKIYWNSDGSTSSGTAMDKNNRTSFDLYYITKAQYDAIAAAIVSDDTFNKAGGLEIYNSSATYKDAGRGFVEGQLTSKNSGSVTLTDGADKAYTEGGDNMYYVLIKGTYTAADTKTYGLVSVASYEMGTVEGNVLDVGLHTENGAGGQVATKWFDTSSSPEPTPEPTSGLLLLLGVAGLALRRKHA